LVEAPGKAICKYALVQELTEYFLDIARHNFLGNLRGGWLFPGRCLSEIEK
jgi:hypothetical protein